MLKLFTRKKLTEEKTANIFANSLLQLVDNGFPEVAALINTDPDFAESPNVDPENSNSFLLIIIAGNLKLLPGKFDNYRDVRLIDLINRKFAQALGADLGQFQQTIASYQSYMSKINHPSKNTLYGMSKAVFYKYELTPFQEEYFKNMNAPNPLFLKRLDSIMENFIWNWDEFGEKYRIV